MPRMKIAMAALFVGAALSAAVASPALAVWLIAGEELPEGSKAALATTAKVATAMVMSIPALKAKVACKSGLLHAESPEIIGGPGEIKAKHLTFEGCETTEPTTGCALEPTSTQITTQPIVGYVVEGSTSSIENIEIMPQTKTTIASFPFSEKNTCAFDGEEPLKGKVALRAPTGQEAKVEQALEGLGSIENQNLEIGTGNEAFIESGQIDMKLASTKVVDFPLPAVVPVPQEWKAGEFKVGGANPPKETIVFTNKGPGDWIPVVGATYFKEIGAKGDMPFAVSNGMTKPCTVKLEVGDKCELILKFEPPKAEFYLGHIRKNPFARLITVEGKGKP